MRRGRLPCSDRCDEDACRALTDATRTLADACRTLTDALRSHGLPLLLLRYDADSANKGATPPGASASPCRCSLAGRSNGSRPRRLRQA
eukprot:1195694-Prorocentrum_minimum.AAC.3